MGQTSLEIAGYVYLITNLVNGKKYVGCTKVSVERRWVQHRSAAMKGSTFAIHAAIRKYGFQNFSIVIIETVFGTCKDLKVAEIRHIKAHDCVSPRGYNLTEGGEGCDYLVPGVEEKHTEAMRKLPLDPVWRAALAEGIQKRSLNPQWRKAQAEGVRRNAAHNLEWQKKVAENNRKKVKDPEFLRTIRSNMIRAREAQTAKALARDAELPPAEAARRVRDREYMRRKRALKVQ